MRNAKESVLLYFYNQPEHGRHTQVGREELQRHWRAEGSRPVLGRYQVPATTGKHRRHQRRNPYAERNSDLDRALLELIEDEQLGVKGPMYHLTDRGRKEASKLADRDKPGDGCWALLIFVILIIVSLAALGSDDASENSSGHVTSATAVVFPPNQEAKGEYTVLQAVGLLYPTYNETQPICVLAPGDHVLVTGRMNNNAGRPVWNAKVQTGACANKTGWVPVTDSQNWPTLQTP